MRLAIPRPGATAPGPHRARGPLPRVFPPLRLRPPQRHRLAVLCHDLDTDRQIGHGSPPIGREKPVMCITVTLIRCGLGQSGSNPAPSSPALPRPPAIIRAATSTGSSRNAIPAAPRPPRITADCPAHGGGGTASASASVSRSPRRPPGRGRASEKRMAGSTGRCECATERRWGPGPSVAAEMLAARSITSACPDHSPAPTVP